MAKPAKLNKISGVGDSNSAPKGKGANRLKYNEEASGPHSSYARDKDGNIYKYETYGDMHQKGDKRFFDPKKRFDGGKPDGTPGAPHVNKKTKEPIPTPHVQGKNIPGGVRPAKAEEIPGKFEVNHE